MVREGVLRLYFFHWFYKVWFKLTYRLRKPSIMITAAMLSGDGGFVDIRYYLTRPDKAQGKFDIFLTNEETQQRLYLARLSKYGVIRTHHNKYRFDGILLFRNRQYIVKSGGKVTLHFGDLKVAGIEIK